LGYVLGEMGHTAELRLPADRTYIVVAKRAAAALGSVAGFHLEAIDDLTIAVAQAFENAIVCLERFGALAGEIRLSFKMAPDGLEVTVKSTVSGDAELRAQAREAQPHVSKARVQAERAAALVSREQRQEEIAADLALKLMGLFVDDSSYRVDERTGGLRVRLTKYRIS
jgi:anti-sigma regulatory factor (Ser/Thr protein kinase)